MPKNDTNEPQRELSQKQKDQLRSRNGELPKDQKTTLNSSEVQEGPKGGQPAQ